MAGGGLGGQFIQNAVFKRADTNGDGKISRAEYDAFVKRLPRFTNNPELAKELFDRLDVDKDGWITEMEFQKLSLR